SLERHVAAGAVDGFDGAGLEVDALEPPAAVILGLRQRPDAALFAMPFEAAIVRDIAFAVGPDRGAVWAAAGCRDDALCAVGRNASGTARRTISTSVWPGRRGHKRTSPASSPRNATKLSGPISATSLHSSPPDASSGEAHSKCRRYFQFQVVG